MRFRIELNGNHAEDSALGFRTLCDGLVTSLRDAGYTVTGSACDWDTSEPRAGKVGEEVSEFLDEVVIGESTGDGPYGKSLFEVIEEKRSLAGIDFASDNSAELAATLGLNTSHFDGRKPSGKGGFTSRDVRRAAR